MQNLSGPDKCFPVSTFLALSRTWDRACSTWNAALLMWRLLQKLRSIHVRVSSPGSRALLRTWEPRTVWLQDTARLLKGPEQHHVNTHRPRVLSVSCLGTVSVLCWPAGPGCSLSSAGWRRRRSRSSWGCWPPPTSPSRATTRRRSSSSLVTLTVTTHSTAHFTKLPVFYF